MLPTSNHIHHTSVIMHILRSCM